LCKQWLEAMGIGIHARIHTLAGVADAEISPVHPQVDQIGSDFPVIDPESGFRMREAIAKAKENRDSVGGIIECIITNLPAGIGEPMFGGVESKIAAIVYGIPAVKAVEFGAGFSSAYYTGQDLNDEYAIEAGKIVTVTNFSGGILGGITNGMPLIFRVAVKPTPSISLSQQSVSLSRNEITELTVTGRHDPCIVPRAVPVVEAAAAIAVYDLILGNTQTNRRKV
jgi:chorismate synthase